MISPAVRPLRDFYDLRSSVELRDELAEIRSGIHHVATALDILEIELRTIGKALRSLETETLQLSLF